MCQFRQGFFAGDGNVFLKISLSAVTLTGKGYCGQANWQPTCVSIKIMTPKGQIVGKVYIIETITADKGCKILRCSPIEVKKTSFWLYLCFLKIITDYWCCRLSNRTLVEDGLSLNGTTLFELRYDESEHRFYFPLKSFNSMKLQIAVSLIFVTSFCFLIPRALHSH